MSLSLSLSLSHSSDPFSISFVNLVKFKAESFQTLTLNWLTHHFKLILLITVSSLTIICPLNLHTNQRVYLSVLRAMKVYKMKTSLAYMLIHWIKHLTKHYCYHYCDCFLLILSTRHLPIHSYESKVTKNCLPLDVR